MQKLTEAAVRDSAAMKQIAFLTMLYLPPSFIAVSFLWSNSVYARDHYSLMHTPQSVYGMNVTELSTDTKGTLVHYFATAIPFTVVTIWVIVASQGRYHVKHANTSFWMRLWWPITWVMDFLYPPKHLSREEEDAAKKLYAKLPEP
jgi:hypothetical protein